MPARAHSGRARISIRHPAGLGESDRSGFWYNHRDLVRQFQWAGSELVDTGLLVGPDEVDIPNPQFRSIILPADPYPLINPRPSPNVTGIPIVGQPLPTTPGNLGFTQYGLGQFILPLSPPSMPAVVAQVVANSGVTVPAGLAGYVVPIARNATTTIALANPNRTWFLIFNPTQMNMQISTSTAVLGGLGNLAIGPGEAYFWATLQGLGTVYQGAMTAVSTWGGNLPLWVWEDNAGGLLNDGGVLALTGNAFPGWPTVAGAPGTVYSNGGMCSVSPGGVPVPGTPLFFGAVTASELLLLGGLVLPIVSPTPGSGQLWNNGGIIEIA